jgi:hypothetical protein
MTMTTITDMEALTSVPEGETITLPNQGNAVWTRTADGFVRNGLAVEAEHFLIEVANNGVRVGAIPTIGQLWLDSSNYYRYITNARTEDGVEVWDALMLYYDGSPYGDISTSDPNENWGQPVEESDWPTWYTPAYRALIQQCRTQRRLTQRAEDRHRTAVEALDAERTESRALRNRLATEGRVNRESFDIGMTSWFAGATLTDAELSDLNSVLAEHGFTELREMENIEVTVSVSGHTYATVDNDLVEQWVGENVDDFDEDRFRIDWQKSLSFTFEVESGDCACDQVSNTMVRSALAEANLTADDFEFEADCENG